MKSRIPFIIVSSILLLPIIAFIFLNNSKQICKRLPIVIPELDSKGKVVVNGNGDTMGFPIPSFTCINQYGESYNSDSLKGKIHIANFIFTTCPTICKDLSSKMSILQNKIRGSYPDIRLLSFSVDPEVDTPDILYKYSKRYNAVKGQWHFLTGNKEEIYKLLHNGYKVPLSENSNAEMKINHSALFVLVDPNLRIRGFYNVIDSGFNSKELDRLLVEIDVLRCEFNKEK